MNNPVHFYETWSQHLATRGKKTLIQPVSNTKIELVTVALRLKTSIRDVYGLNHNHGTRYFSDVLHGFTHSLQTTAGTVSRAG
jgi:hypothetical protein